MGGDFDGDKLFLRGVFTQEANQEAEEIINSKKYLLDGSGNSNRETGNEFIQSMYTLTKE